MTDPSEELTSDPARLLGAMPLTPNLNAPCSEACYRFQLQHFRIFDFFLFGVKLSTAADNVRFAAAKALAVGGKIEDQKRFEEVRNNPDPSFRKLKSFSGYQSGLMIIRLVDNFMSFLSETLQACMLRRPEILRSKEHVRIDDVLRFSSRRELIDFLVNRKINELSYGGLRGIEEFMFQRLGIELINGDARRASINISIELRNIYTHNRGVVNELFMSRTADYDHNYDFSQGKKFHADFDEIVGFSRNLFEVAVGLDKTVRSKFKLPSKQYRAWDASRLTRLRKTDEKSAIASESVDTGES